jgi:hypothetical protein
MLENFTIEINFILDLKGNAYFLLKKSKNQKLTKKIAKKCGKDFRSSRPSKIKEREKPSKITKKISGNIIYTFLLYA